jgi:hypothetical protein
MNALRRTIPNLLRLLSRGVFFGFRDWRRASRSGFRGIRRVRMDGSGAATRPESVRRWPPLKGGAFQGPSRLGGPIPPAQNRKRC